MVTWGGVTAGSCYVVVQEFLLPLCIHLVLFQNTLEACGNARVHTQKDQNHPVFVTVPPLALIWIHRPHPARRHSEMLQSLDTEAGGGARTGCSGILHVY